MGNTQDKMNGPCAMLASSHCDSDTEIITLSSGKNNTILQIQSESIVFLPDEVLKKYNSINNPFNISQLHVSQVTYKMIQNIITDTCKLNDVVFLESLEEINSIFLPTVEDAGEACLFGQTSILDFCWKRGIYPTYKAVNTALYEYTGGFEHKQLRLLKWIFGEPTLIEDNINNSGDLHHESYTILVSTMNTALQRNYLHVLDFGAKHGVVPTIMVLDKVLKSTECFVQTRRLLEWCENNKIYPSSNGIDNIAVGYAKIIGQYLADLSRTSPSQMYPKPYYNNLDWCLTHGYLPTSDGMDRVSKISYGGVVVLEICAKIGIYPTN